MRRAPGLGDLRALIVPKRVTWCISPGQGVRHEPFDCRTDIRWCENGRAMIFRSDNNMTLVVLRFDDRGETTFLSGIFEELVLMIQCCRLWGAWTVKAPPQQLNGSPGREDRCLDCMYHEADNEE